MTAGPTRQPAEVAERTRAGVKDAIDAYSFHAIFIVAFAQVPRVFGVARTDYAHVRAQWPPRHRVGGPKQCDRRYAQEACQVRHAGVVPNVELGSMKGAGKFSQRSSCQPTPFS